MDGEGCGRRYIKGSEIKWRRCYLLYLNSMFFQPILVAPYPFLYNFLPTEFCREALEPPSESAPLKHNSTYAAQKFKELLNRASSDNKILLDTEYMNLSPRYSNIELPAKEDFVSLYEKTLQRYRVSYGNNKVKRSWSQHDVTILLWMINWIFRSTNIHPLDFLNEDWAVVAEVIPFRSNDDCKFKWLSMRNNQLEDCPWTPEEKLQLASLVKYFQGSQSEVPVDWVLISQIMHQKFPDAFRTPKQCKESWSIILSSRFDKSKKFWSQEEDLTLLDSFIRFGKRWKMIGSLIPGRSQNAIKNRFTLLSHKLSGNQLKSLSSKELVMLLRAKLIEDINTNALPSL